MSNTQTGLINNLLQPLKWLFQFNPQSINSDNDTRRSYESAATFAFQTNKFFLVYLHSPIHEDTDKFCRNVLSSSNVIQYMNQNLVVWAGKVWDPQAYGLSIQLKASAFPFLALIVCQSDRVVQVIDRIQGYIEEDQLLERLRNCIAANNSLLSRIQQENIRRQEFTLLREQQDREYREAEEADRLERERREAQALEQRRLEEEERHRIELEEALKLSEQLNREGLISKLRNEIKAEPDAGLKDEVATIRFQLPQGGKISRRFLKTDTIKSIKDFLLVYFYDQGLNITNISIATHFPKVELNEMDSTIFEKGLFPRGMLYVQDLDA